MSMFLKLYKVYSDDDGHVTECFNGSGLNIALSMINEFKKELT